MERADTGHAKADQVRTARKVAAMFDELRRLADRHAELSADRVRLEAGALRAELHGARLDTAAAGRMADEANRRAAELGR